MVLFDWYRDLRRIWQRNLGRDSRICCHFSRASRLPFLDEDLLAFVGFALPFEMVVGGPQSVILPLPTPPVSRRCPVLTLPSTAVRDARMTTMELAGRRRDARAGESGRARRNFQVQEANRVESSQTTASGLSGARAVPVASAASGAFSLLSSRPSFSAAPSGQYCRSFPACCASASSPHSCHTGPMRWPSSVALPPAAEYSCSVDKLLSDWQGNKWLLRVLLLTQSMPFSAMAKKRAIQFGTRAAQLSNRRCNLSNRQARGDAVFDLQDLEACHSNTITAKSRKGTFAGKTQASGYCKAGSSCQT